MVVLSPWLHFEFCMQNTLAERSRQTQGLISPKMPVFTRRWQGDIRVGRVEVESREARGKDFACKI
ncbi:hypothetical protein LGM39_10220 [Burkholderia cepacia]|uniref:hypothetical protein n=1 Tax=Burkholderia cepacia TaxID=292 RepID=UPI001CF3F6D4|nr:hypothetical protein [Burkholderia cepacia]MCA7899746.1 hypothetical protein [Burkholderia cepacia]MCA7927964.1 hypothetical protein [Burkholderia cepacia]